MNDTIYYIFHVERAAGTTLRHILFDHYGWYTGIVYPHYFEWEGKKGLVPFFVNDEVSKATFIIGHAMYYGIHKVIGKPHHYVTFLRDPVKRMESIFNHIRSEDKRKGLEPPDFRTWFGYWHVLTHIHSLCRPKEANLDKAKEILRNCSFIGLQETFQEDVNQLFYPRVYNVRKNVAEEWTKKVGIPLLRFTPEEEAEVRKAMEEDYELYNYALDLREKGHNKGFQFPSLNETSPVQS